MPDILTRFEQAGDDSQERGRLSIAEMALIGLGAYAGLRYFPRQMLVRAADAIERGFRGKPRMQRLLGRLYRDVGERSRLPAQGGPTHTWAAGLGQVNPASYGDVHALELESHLETAVRGLMGRDPIVGTSDTVVNALIAEADRLGPQPFRGLRRATVADISRVQGPINTMLSEFLGGSLNRIDNSWRRFVNQPQIRQALARRGMSPGELARRVSLGPGMFFDEAGRFYGASRFTPDKLIDWVTGARVPFTPFRPLRLLFPTEMFHRGPLIERLGPEFAHGAPGQEDVLETLYAGGKLFGVKRGPSGTKELGPQIPGVWRLGRTSSGMARGAAARMQDALDIPVDDLERDRRLYEPVDEFMRRHTGLDRFGIARLETGLYTRDAEGEVVRRSNLNKFQSVLADLFEFGEQKGVGPAYSTRPFGGRFLGFFRGLLDKATKTARITEEVRAGTVRPVQKTPIPERDFISRLLRRPPQPELPEQLGELSLWDKLIMKFGGTPTRRVKVDSGKLGRNVDLPVARYTQSIDPPPALETVKLQPGFRGQYYAYQKHQGFTDWLNYQLIRPNWLLEELGGINIKPSKTVLGNLLKPLTHIALPAYAAYEGARYIDYKIGRVTGQQPTQVVGNVLAGLNTSAQFALDKAGVTENVKELEELFPGVESSPLSKGARFLASTMGGAVIGARAGSPKAGLLAGVLMGIWNLGDMTKTSDELEALYEGEELVPVKRNRWWVLGADPWEGSEIEYYKKHWIAELRGSSDPRSYSIYGGKKAAWRGSWLPTPENAFLLKNLFDPYYVERRNYWSRPYPTTGSRFADVPLIGPTLASTVGQILKPTHYMHPESYNTSTGTFPAQAPRAAEEMISHAAQLQLPAMKDYYPTGVLKRRLDVMTSDQIHRLFEFSGMTGFMYSLFMHQAANRTRFNEEPRLADASSIESVARQYYDQQFGGLLGHTELLRRYIVGEPSDPNINPIPNTLPSWLPGSRSEFVKDRDFYLDFHRGDAIAKLTKGEQRVPGPGYEAYRPLHSEVPGIYDPVDRFMVLSDVAPGSGAYDHYKAIVEMWDRAGFLDNYWKKQVARAERRVREKFESGPTEEYRFATKLRTESMVVDEVLGNTKFRAGGKIFHLAGVARSAEAADIAGSDQDPRQLMRALEMSRGRLEALVGKEVQLTVGSPGIASTPAIIDGVNQQAIQSGLWDGSKDPVAAQARFRAGARVAGALWEHVKHIDLPGPFDWFYQKFFGKRSALEQYEKEELAGARFANWLEPWGTIVKPAGREFLSKLSGRPYISDEVQQRRDLDVYFDRLKYLKHRRLSAQAQSMGLHDVAQDFSDKAAATLTGFGIKTDYASIYQALPKTERRYFKAFSRLSDPLQQERVLQAVPEAVRPIYLSVWGRGRQDHKFQSPLLAHYEEGLNPPPSTFGQADQVAANYFQSARIPDDDWDGWHPAVDMEDVRIRTGLYEGMDVHALGAWNSTVQRMDMELPQLGPVLNRQDPTPRDDVEEILRELRRMGHIPHVREPRVGSRSRVHFSRNNLRVRQIGDLELQSSRRGSLY